MNECGAGNYLVDTDGGGLAQQQAISFNVNFLLNGLAVTRKKFPGV